MRTYQKTGFSLIIVLVVLSLVGVAIFILAEISRSIIFESNMAYVQACRRNMTASALAWASENHKDITADKKPKVISLDIETLGIKGGSLAIEWLETGNKTAEVEITTKCKSGRITLDSKNTYRLPQNH
jgi:hypothetical protein